MDGGGRGRGIRRDANWQHRGWADEARSFVDDDRKRKAAQEAEFALINGAHVQRDIPTAPLWPFPSTRDSEQTDGVLHLSRGVKLQRASAALFATAAAKRPRKE